MTKRKKSGLLLVLEGGDGCGKSTQAKLLVEWMKIMNLGVEHVREPGSTRLAESVRGILLDPLTDDISARTEALLFCSARSELYEKVIEPKICEGVNVVCERDYFSTCCFQGQNYSLEELHRICRVSVGYRVPDITLLYKPESPELALARGTAGREADRIEAKGEEFHRKVYEMYYKVVPNFLKEKEGRRIEVIDAKVSIEKVAKETKRIVADLLRERKMIK
jgi:dTMP kinase